MKNPSFTLPLEAGVQQAERHPARMLSKNSPLDLAYAELVERVYNALSVYSNVHRGSGHFSAATTALFEEARSVILKSLSLREQDYQVIFCSVYFADLLKARLKPEDYIIMSSEAMGLPLGLRVMVIKKRALPHGIPIQTGGSTARMVSANYVVWADAPHIHEAGTPSVINAITFAIAVLLRKQYMISNFSSHDTRISAGDILYSDELAGFTGLKLIAELQNSLPGRNVDVETMDGKTGYINFDNAASTPAFMPVWNAVKLTWHLSRVERINMTEEVRKIIAGFLHFNHSRYEIIFSANTTEAINIASRIIASHFKEESQPVILNTLLEHNSNELPWRYLRGFTHVRVNVSREGIINTAELEEILRKYNNEKAYGPKRICVVAVSGASNVLGTYSDIHEISAIAHRYGARLLVDGAQLIAHREIHIEENDIDFFAFSGHKAYAPFGSGALIVRKELADAFADELRNIARAGDENTVGIAAMGKALVLLQRAGMKVVEENEHILTNRLLNALQSVKGIRVYGIPDADSHQRGGIVSVETRNYYHGKLARQLAVRGGIGVRYGCFCSHMMVKHVLRIPRFFIGLQNTVFTLAPNLSKQIPGLLRISFGIENSAIEVDRFVEVLRDIIEKQNNGEKNTGAIKELQTENFSNLMLEKVFG